MPTIKELLAAKRASEAALDKETAIAKKRGDMLFGTGLTKREVAKMRVQESTARKLFKFKNIEPPSVTSIETVLKAKREASGEVYVPPLPSQPPVVDIRKSTEQGPGPLHEQGIVLDEYQHAAVEGLRNEKFGCLIGAAGTGKTTSLEFLIEELVASLPTIDLNDARGEWAQTDYADEAPAVAFCSFTGRAVEQMRNKLNRKYHGNTDTIHGLLGYAPEYIEYTDSKGEIQIKRIFRPTFTKYNKLPYRLVIVDEASMCPIYLWNELIDALIDDCRVILVGDINQLPPVQGRSVLGFALLNWPSFELLHLHRQAEGDPIARNAHRILRGQFPEPVNRAFIVKPLDAGSTGMFNKTVAVLRYMSNNGSFDPMQDAVITPKNVGTLGQMHFNEKLVHLFNPPREVEGIVVNPRILIKSGFTTQIFGVGDKVMMLANDRERGLTNGQIGEIVEINRNGAYRGAINDSDSGHGSSDGADFSLDDLTSMHEQIVKEFETQKTDDEDDSVRQASHIVRIKFARIDDAIEFSTAGEMNRLSLAYAFTCHKSQGGEYRNVIIVIHSADLKMLSREWLYTAVTRAKQSVILLTDTNGMTGSRGLHHALRRQIIKGNNIEEKAKCFIELEGKDDTLLPNLPAPEKVE